MACDLITPSRATHASIDPLMCVTGVEVSDVTAGASDVTAESANVTVRAKAQGSSFEQVMVNRKDRKES